MSCGHCQQIGCKMTPIQLYSYQTPNGHKASIMLEETGLPYDVHIVDIEKGDQFRPEFLVLNPNNKIPVIVDPDRHRTVFESGAILLYLADRSGVLKPRNETEAGLTLQWMLFQAAHVGPALGQLWNYKVFVAETLPQVIARFERETARVLRVLDGQLEPEPYVVGGQFGIADVMTWPWINAASSKIGVDLAPYPHIARWFAEIGSRPAVQRGLRVPALDERKAATPESGAAS
ncbi:glutathione S-transferase family protein [Pseudochelatococcus sp. B33]